MENMDGIRFLNFKRKTSSGVPFCFTIEAGNGTAGCIAKEIFSFVSAAVPEQCAKEWMIQSEQWSRRSSFRPWLTWRMSS